MRSLRLVVTSVAGLVLALNASVQQTEACPFCSAPSLTLSEQIALADAVVLVKWQSARKSDGQQPGNTTYTIAEVVKGSGTTLKEGGIILLNRYRVGKKNDLFLLLGSKAVNVEWGSPLEVSRASFAYIKNAPSPKRPAKQWLEYFLNYLEFPDILVANDAYAEFANAPYKDITSLSGKMSRERLRKWITDSQTPQTRLGLYGMMLGLCGTKEDAKLMRDKITAKTEEFRLGIDGVIAGYLLLAGEEGLTLIEETKLKNKKAPFSETYAAMQALRFLWTYAPDKVDKQRLKKSMRTLLDRPELCDLVIADLARWQDWSVQDKLMELYSDKEYNIPSIKRAIVRFMLISSKGVIEKNPPNHVLRARAHLALLEKQDPKTVRNAKRFFFIK
ncbi:MAG: hypothetical protein IID45_13975 [Planctomycetes bacterium]|nr:hypothetical protein [Planctomycetota bacterium]